MGIDLRIVPSKNYDGSSCSIPTLDFGDSQCGVTISDNGEAFGTTFGTESAELASTTDAATFKDYTYAIYAYRRTTRPDDQDPETKTDADYNLAYSRLKLNLYGELNGIDVAEYVYTVLRVILLTRAISGSYSLVASGPIIRVSIPEAPDSTAVGRKSGEQTLRHLAQQFVRVS